MRKNKNRLRLSSTSIVIATLTSLHFALIILFDKVTALAPDEANYIGIFRNLYRSDFSLDGYLGWQEESVNALRVIYLPAKILEIIGFSEFYAVRTLSILYSMLSLYFLLQIAPERKILGRTIKFWLASAYFIPSIFLWGSLGLRESFIFFSAVSIFYLFVNPHNLSFKKQFLLLSAASTFFMISKIYLFGLLLICLVASVLILSISKRNFDRSLPKLLSALLVPLLLFPSIAAKIVTSAIDTQEVIGITPTPTSTPTTTPTTTPTGKIASRGQTLHILNEQLDENPILSWLSTITGVQNIISEKAQKSYLPEGSQKLSENTTQLQTQPASLQEPLSIIVAAYNFAFVPTPFVDNGSFFLNAGSYESFAWYFYYLVFIVLLVGLLRGRYAINLATISSTLFTLAFIILSALIEINDGTALRHRAVLLLGILLMLAIYRSKEPLCSQHLDANF